MPNFLLSFTSFAFIVRLIDKETHSLPTVKIPTTIKMSTNMHNLQEKESSSDETLTQLMKAERTDMLRYACIRLGNLPDAEDVVQDVYLRLKTTEQHVPANKWRAYVYRSLSNLCTDRLRGLSKQHFVSLEQAKDIANADNNIHGIERDFRRITLLLAGLPPEQAEVIRLRLHADKSFAEIADILNVPLTTAKSRFQYGIEKLRKGLRR